ncbi:MAG TPA: acetyl-CoA carboxylase carboxyl transferase subunit alpha [Lachnospiraceae bacterium]|jgi:acetyl-CoA carboxylase carboxyl transferase subunit alpha|nr:acetyl-CoA carboxylase carboxyl transferase subunit alpha [Lachnospiraceae bacterium]HBZ89689.1 acetyl-CoA carboxylase carboxyl transferase subunit alpha [Lachnospiraceae bacterium]
MTDIEIVRGARSEKRLTAVDYINGIVNGFIEMHGDRYFGDDAALIGGIGRLGKRAVTVLGIEKGKNTKEHIKYNFGSVHPEGYRKALRLMKQAEKFDRPIICFVDTAGAYCGVDAEERGQGRAIADNLFEMTDISVPIISVIIGEGGSGGALALCHADRIWMLDDAYFSVVSPESCSNILWKTTDKADVAAKALCLTSEKLMELQIIDKVIKSGSVKKLKSELEKELLVLSKVSKDRLLDDRYEKFRKIGYDWS